MMDFNRRTILGALAGLVAQKTTTPAPKPVAPAPAPPVAHECSYLASPFWLQAAASYTEPTPAPCSMLVPLQMCACGSLRVLPATAAKLAGRVDMKGDK